MGIKIIIFCLIIICIISINSCDKKPANIANGKKENTLIIRNSKLGKMKNGLLGKQIKYSEESSQNNQIIFYFSAYDCSDCIQESASLLNQLKKNIVNQKDIIIMSSSPFSIFNTDLINLDHRFIFDNKDKKRASLNYFSTPVFFILDQNDKIIDLYFVTTDENNFIEKFDFIEIVNETIKLNSKLNAS